MYILFGLAAGEKRVQREAACAEYHGMFQPMKPRYRALSS